MRARLDSVFDIAFIHVIGMGRDGDDGDTIAMRAVGRIAEGLLLDPDFLTDFEPRQTYVWHIVWNVLKTEWSAANRRRRIESENSDIYDIEPSPTYDPESILDVMEQEHELREANKAIAQLPKQKQEQIIDHYLNEQPTKAIADAAGKQDGTVRVQISESLKKVRATLGVPSGRKNRGGATS
jgi:RNA polymerase sigma factor (sigma-70 family)